MNDDQSIQAASMEKALTLPGPLIDSRTERDRLNFIARFASLVNFYDHHNRHRGNWEPFVLKDPVFLTAWIAATDHRQLHSSYVNACVLLNKLIAQHDPDTGKVIGKLLDILTDVFLLLRKWVHYMQLSADEYPLKSYTLGQVKDVYSHHLRALLSLREKLVQHQIIPAFNNDLHETGLFDAIDSMIWNGDHSGNTYSELPGLIYPVNQNTPENLAAVIKSTGDKVFEFLYGITGHATEAMQELQTRRTKFPDTLLLRAFANILALQQEQLNLLTVKHLDFYYREILKLREKDALPDHAFLCATLLQNKDVLFLPAGTLFDAGTDEKNLPISFVSEEDTILQPSTITRIYTVAEQQTTNGYQLVRAEVDDAAKVKVDADGNLSLWKTFGGDEGMVVSQAFAFASPLLLLREGERRITITLSIVAADQRSFDGVRFYLSTRQTWLPVTADASNKITDDNKRLSEITISILVDSSQPPIEAFFKDAAFKDPDGLQSEWPLLKMEFLSYAERDSAVIVKSIKLHVTASGVKQLVLHNDLGPVDLKVPAPIFGTAPVVDNSFVIGSNEIFSKPLDSLQLQLTWDKLPADLADYYKEYNAWLSNDLTVPAKRKSTGQKLLEWFVSILKKFFHWMLRLFGKKTIAEKNSSCPVFNNTSFTFDLAVLEKDQWKSFTISKAKELGITNNELSYIPYTADESCCYKAAELNNILFSTDGVTCILTNESRFVLFDKQQTGMLSFNADPFIQRSPLIYSGSNASGFIKMSLAGPAPGFGSAIYSSVLTGIALHNAWILYNSQPGEDIFGFPEKKEKPVFMDAAKIPFVPKLNSIQVNYSATQEYLFTGEVNHYPVQCFYYTPFYNYKVYDQDKDPSTLDRADFFYRKADTQQGLPLFQPIQYKGILFTEFDHFIASQAINFYFELRQRSHTAAPGEMIRCCYLSETGWKELKLLSDTTYNFTCSGIIKCIVPADIPQGSTCRFAICATGEPASKAATAFVSINGIPVRRSPGSLASFKGIPLPAGSITQPVRAIAAIASVIQPFASFGGRPAESSNDMYIRVANRLATKDRAVTKDDIPRLISEQFPTVYFSKAVRDTDHNTIRVYTAGAVQQKANNEMPFVNDTILMMIKQMLNAKTSSFYNVSVSNFKFRYLQIVMQLTPEPGQLMNIPADINNTLRIFLSPWINNDAKNIAVDKLVLAPGETSSLKKTIGQFVKNMEGVRHVKQVQFRVWDIAAGPQTPPDIITTVTDEATNNDNEYYLLIPALQHAITLLT